jgi:putative sigma-54 modulation protein
MQINVTGHHVELTEGLHEAVTQKCKKIASHYPDISNINVVLTVDKHTQTAEATTHFLGQDIVAKASAVDLYHAIPDMGAKLQASLHKRKEITKSHSHSKPPIDTHIDDESDAALAS